MICYNLLNTLLVDDLVAVEGVSVVSSVFVFLADRLEDEGAGVSFSSDAPVTSLVFLVDVVLDEVFLDDAGAGVVKTSSVFSEGVTFLELLDPIFLVLDDSDLGTDLTGVFN